MFNRKVLFLLAALFLVLAGCSTGEKENDSADSGKKVTVDVFQFKVEFKKQFEELAKQYEEVNPDVKVNIQTVGGGNDYASALKAKFASGDEPAIFNINGIVDIQQYRDRLADLSETEAAKSALEGTLAGVEEDGQVLGLPYNQEGYGLIYNKDIFKEAGVDPESITSMEDLIKAVETIDGKKEELKLDAVFAFPAKEKWVTGNHAASVFLASDFDNDVLKAYEAKEVAFSNSDAFKQYIDLQNEYSVQPVMSLDYSQQVEELFSTERVAIIQQGNWVYPTVEEMDPELAESGIGIMPIPLNGEMNMPVGVPNFWAVNKKVDEEVQKAAGEFLDWMYTSEEGKEASLTEFKFIPAYEGYDTEKISDPLSKEIYEYAEKGQTTGWVFQSYPIGWGENVLGAELQKYLSDKATWEETIQKTQDEWAKSRE
ncbi:ABC transporter substrate-binding protein [Bacillus sp. FSL K6-3431]|uniref:ABC transporter substrate-binding protein n=1 Tax=Bacillus sp. FSL K6-3431 TaxID=2921500 RepID=UPI0030F4EBFE